MPARCRLFLLLVGLLLALEPACCQEARGSLQPWSQGVIAVVVFLVLVAIALVVNRFWCKEKVRAISEARQPGVLPALRCHCDSSYQLKPLPVYASLFLGKASEIALGENVETVVSVEDKHEAVMSNGHEGRYPTAAANFRSKESQHAYENTLEPEEKVITTAM